MGLPGTARLVIVRIGETDVRRAVQLGKNAVGPRSIKDGAAGDEKRDHDLLRPSSRATSFLIEAQVRVHPPSGVPVLCTARISILQSGAMFLILLAPIVNITRSWI